MDKREKYAVDGGKEEKILEIEKAETKLLRYIGRKIDVSVRGA